nr:13841_t:CDS:2 [Entrophospora candida]CAG8565660.1 11909_t:CDS:2 [Entrophospora candida]
MDDEKKTRPRSRSLNFRTGTPTTTKKTLSIQFLLNLETKLFPKDNNNNDNLFLNNQYTKSKRNRNLSPIPVFGPLLERKRWRCISYLIVVVIILALVQGVLMFLDSSATSKFHQLQIGLFKFKFIIMPIRYIDIPPMTTQMLEGKRIFHVTKEYGYATINELGHAVTDLVRAQVVSNASLDVNVIMPLYPFLRGYHNFSRYTELAIDVQDDDGSIVQSIFTARRSKRSFNLAHEYREGNDIYPTSKTLLQEWDDLYFCKAAAELITYINNDVDASIFATNEEQGVDLVHVHGARNALVVEFLNDFNAANNRFSRPPPAIVYTIHDHVEEQGYSINLESVLKFVNLNDYMLENYFHNNHMYTSSLAIDQADYVTFVSYKMAKDIVERPMSFSLKDMLMFSILKRARARNWIGISNGVGLRKYNPFNDKLLIDTQSNFPKNIYNESFMDEIEYISLYNDGDDEGNYNSESGGSDLIVSAKYNARKYLIKNELLNEKDLDRVIVLFVIKVGRDKSMPFVDDAVEIITQLGAKFIIIGRNDVSLGKHTIKRLRKKYPDDVMIINDLRVQKKMEVLYRAAADVLFVPNITEDFGLVAVEGLLFGSTVVSTGVGGLKEFLINKTQDTISPTMTLSSSLPPSNDLSDQNDSYNSYLFNLYKEEDKFDVSIEEMKSALSKSIIDMTEWSNDLRAKEVLLRRLVNDALRLSWNRPDGPIDQYTKVYKMAIKKHQDDLIKLTPNLS